MGFAAPPKGGGEPFGKKRAERKTAHKLFFSALPIPARQMHFLKTHFLALYCVISISSVLWVVLDNCALLGQICVFFAKLGQAIGVEQSNISKMERGFPHTRFKVVTYYLTKGVDKTPILHFWRDGQK